MRAQQWALVGEDQALPRVHCACTLKLRSVRFQFLSCVLNFLGLTGVGAQVWRLTDGLTGSGRFTHRLAGSSHLPGSPGLRLCPRGTGNLCPLSLDPPCEETCPQEPCCSWGLTVLVQPEQASGLILVKKQGGLIKQRQALAEKCPLNPSFNTGP